MTVVPKPINLPSWLMDGIKIMQKKSTPDWLQEGITKMRTVEPEDKEVTARRQVQDEGDFTTQLMSNIRGNEAPSYGYNDWYGRGFGSGPIDPPKQPTRMTINEVLRWQNQNNPTGPATAAVGAYQIVDQPNARTLSWLVRKMGLSGEELFDEQMQDRMAVTLMQRRGLDKFLGGKISANKFAAGIAREWASSPVIAPDKRGKTPIAVGSSYYEGDGINSAFKGRGKLEAYTNLFRSADTFSE